MELGSAFGLAGLPLSVLTTPAYALAVSGDESLP